MDVKVPLEATSLKRNANTNKLVRSKNYSPSCGTPDDIAHSFHASIYIPKACGVFINRSTTDFFGAGYEERPGHLYIALSCFSLMRFVFKQLRSWTTRSKPDVTCHHKCSAVLYKGSSLPLLGLVSHKADMESSVPDRQLLNIAQKRLGVCRGPAVFFRWESIMRGHVIPYLSALLKKQPMG